MNTLVLGLGNILVSDEGVGVHVVNALERAYDLPNAVEVLDGGTSGMDLLDTIAGRDHLIVADAIRSDKPPASIVKLTGDEVHAFFQTKISPHQLGLCDLLASLALSDEAPERVTIVGIVPDDLELGTDLSPRVAEACDAAVEMIVEILSENGQVPEPRQLAAIGTA